MKEIVSKLDEEAGKCIRCGFCEAVCPTLQAKDYSLYYGARGRVILANELLGLLKRKSNGIELNVGNAFYSCLECSLCHEICPADVNAGNVSNIAKQLIVANENIFETSQIVSAAKVLSNTIMKYKNPLGLRREIAEWSKELKFDQNSDTVLLTGHMYQIMAYTQGLIEFFQKTGRYGVLFLKISEKVPGIVRFSKYFVDRDLKKRLDACIKNVSILLKNAGVEFSYFGDEPYPGTLLYEFGYIQEFVEYATQVREWLKDKNIRRIIAIDPHTYHILGSIYKEYIQFDFEVVHYLDFLSELEFRESEDTITYHEPCIFTRKKEYNLPREILGSIANVKYPVNSGKNSVCCGGPVESIFPEISERVSSKRYGELRNTGARKIITACPVCFLNLHRQKEVLDISEFLVDNLAWEKANFEQGYPVYLI